MSETGDNSQKTEEPTQRRLEEARRKGQVPMSREVNHWFMILAATLITVSLAPAALGGMMRAMRTFIEQPHAIPTDLANLTEILQGTAGAVALVVALPLAVLLAAAAAPGLIQAGPMFSPERIQPKLEKISLAKGLKRLFSLKSIAEFVKGVAKLAIVGAVAAALFWPVFGEAELYISLDAVALMDLLRDLSGRMLVGVLAVVSVIAALDYLYQRFEFTKSMRMSRQELKDELKQTEGDPHVKARLRQIRMERARRRMMAAVPDADVVITNPTHFAVALVYDMETMAAPRLVAKGTDRIALRIREVAEEHDVPVVENPPLARALHAGVELDAEVSPEHYKAVAEVIGYVMRLRGERSPVPRGRGR